MGKIFGIGLMKTGTTSLCHALEILGYSAIQSPEPLERINQYDAAADRNITENFEYLDRLYPGSKFIYTIRDTSSWIQSFLHHKRQKKIMSGESPDPAKHHFLRSYDYIDEKVLEEGYAKHDERVRHYFHDRPDVLLTVNLCDAGDKWSELCHFLDRPIPDLPFPHSNPARSITRILLRKARRSVKAGTKHIRR